MMRLSPSRCGGLAVVLLVTLAGSVGMSTAGAQPVPLASTEGAPAGPALPTTAPTLPSMAPAPIVEPSVGAAPAVAAPNGTAPGPSVIANATLPRDLSPWSMFIHADIVVKVVMVGLALASVTTWTVWIAKTMHLLSARRRVVRGVRALMKAGSLEDLAVPRAEAAVRAGPVAALLHAAVHEHERSAALAPDGIKERAAIALGRVEARAARDMTRGTGVVASIGSTAPFVGLFGTVWGIMNAFVGISQAHTTNLAVVAPGIAEALLATAIGLVAAIPAVIIFNSFARAIASYKALLADASAEVMRHLSRDLDRRPQPGA